MGHPQAPGLEVSLADVPAKVLVGTDWLRPPSYP
jgi:hypothetical protein